MLCRNYRFLVRFFFFFYSFFFPSATPAEGLQTHRLSVLHPSHSWSCLHLAPQLTWSILFHFNGRSQRANQVHICSASTTLGVTHTQHSTAQSHTHNTEFCPDFSMWKIPHVNWAAACWNVKNIGHRMALIWCLCNMLVLYLFVRCKVEHDRNKAEEMAIYFPASAVTD